MTMMERLEKICIEDIELEPVIRMTYKLLCLHRQDSAEVKHYESVFRTRIYMETNDSADRSQIFANYCSFINSTKVEYSSTLLNHFPS
jgi:hypothetical protein